MTMAIPAPAEYLEHWVVLAKSCVIGTISGALPGGGASIAAFLAYGEAARTSKHPERFNNGAIDGLMAAEASNNASTGGSMTILLVLGDRAELSLRRALLLSLGDPWILVSRPISAVLLALAVFFIIYPLFKKSKMFRES